jgi:transcriptional regulator with XRE-family HTH domain
MKPYSSKLINDILGSTDPVEQAKVDVKMLIAVKIADALKAKGWRYIDLLKALKMENPSIITRWLSGTNNFTVDTLIELGEALDISFLNLEEPKGRSTFYSQSASQKATTKCYDPSIHKFLHIIQEESPVYKIKSDPKKIKLPKQYA